MIDQLFGIGPKLQLVITTLALVAVSAMMLHHYFSKDRPFMGFFFGALALHESWSLTFWLLEFAGEHEQAKTVEAWAPEVLPSILFFATVCILTDFYQQRGTKYSSMINGAASACMIWVVATGATVLLKDHSKQFTDIIKFAGATVGMN